MKDNHYKELTKKDLDKVLNEISESNRRKNKRIFVIFMNKADIKAFDNAMKEAAMKYPASTVLEKPQIREGKKWWDKADMKGKLLKYLLK